MNIPRAVSIVAAFLLVFSGPVQAETGPLMNLSVSYMYTNDSAGMYIQIDGTSPMPGCYGDRGARLYASHANFDQVYAQILLMIAQGGMQGQVLYHFSSSGSGWSTCTLDGFALRPGS